MTADERDAIGRDGAAPDDDGAPWLRGPDARIKLGGIGADRLRALAAQGFIRVLRVPGTWPLYSGADIAALLARRTTGGTPTPAASRTPAARQRAADRSVRELVAKDW